MRWLGDDRTVNLEVELTKAGREWLDRIDRELAAEEHRQGLRPGEDPSHCADCSAEADRLARERAIAECEHPTTTELAYIDRVEPDVICTRCGTTVEHGRG